MSASEALIIFVKNPELGKVKTRLAKTIGDEKALEVYLQLMKHTREVVSALSVDKHLFYSQTIAENDLWPSEVFTKHIQDENPDLGAKMNTAFKTLMSYQKCLIVGSDCPQISEEIINDAYSKLENIPVVIGPALDGGYYGIGFNAELIGRDRYLTFLEDIFLNKTWSHENVLKEAEESAERFDLEIAKLPPLSDLDYEEDLQYLK